MVLLLTLHIIFCLKNVSLLHIINQMYILALGCFKPELPTRIRGGKWKMFMELIMKLCEMTGAYNSQLHSQSVQSDLLTIALSQAINFPWHKVLKMVSCCGLNNIPSKCNSLLQQTTNFIRSFLIPEENKAKHHANGIKISSHFHLFLKSNKICKCSLLQIPGDSLWFQ